MRTLARLSGRRIDDAAFRQSMPDVQREPLALSVNCTSAQRVASWLYPISEVYALLRAGNLLPPEDHTELLRKYFEMRRRRPTAAIADRVEWY